MPPGQQKPDHSELRLETHANLRFNSPYCGCQLYRCLTDHTVSLSDSLAHSPIKIHHTGALTLSTQDSSPPASNHDDQDSADKDAVQGSVEPAANSTNLMQFTVILVRPIYPRNIGMVARAMNNFGHDRLILIDPQCDLDVDARQGAAQGQRPLHDCTTYHTWDEYAANEPDGTRIAFSRRSGKRRPSEPFAQVLEWPALHDGRPVSLMFGAEDHGLSRDDLMWAHRTATLDIPGPLKSLNLSHAVLLALSQLPRDIPPPETIVDIHTPDAILRKWLETLEFDLSTKNWNAFFALRQMIMKASPTEREMELFTAVLEQTIRAIDPNYSRKNFNNNSDD